MPPLYGVAMASTRLDFAHTAPAVNRALVALAASVDLDPRLRELVKLRASQLNGCSYCVDLHSRDARAEGEDERRIWGVAGWRHHPLFDECERAALALTEAMTPLPPGGVPDAVYDDAARVFGETELANLIGAIISVNAWNLVGVSTLLAPPAELPA
jgi:AhpD family alkylhydroperoxidase